RVPRRAARDLHAGAAQDLAGHTDVREFAVVAAVRHASRARGWKMGGTGDLRRAGNLRTSRDRERWGPVHRPDGNGQRYPLAPGARALIRRDDSRIQNVEIRKRIQRAFLKTS